MKHSVYDIVQRFYRDYLGRRITLMEASELVEDLAFIKGHVTLDMMMFLQIEDLPKEPEELASESEELAVEELIAEEPTGPDKPTEPKEPSGRLATLRAREVKGDQKSAEWLKVRYNYITASVAAACAGLMGAAMLENQILEKASYGEYRGFFGNKYTDIGNIYEPVTDMVYEKKTGHKINHFGLVPSTEIPYLGASTDGITDNLRNIEIKTLASRILDGSIKKEYYNQMQHQMFCLDLDVTDFIEAKYKDCSIESYPAMSCDKGIIVEYLTESGDYAYMYSELGVDVAWIETAEEQIRQDCRKTHIRTFCYILHDYLCQEVYRDPNWIRIMKPKFERFWNEVCMLRNDSNALAKRMAKKGKASTPNFGMSMF